jgi:hypothetical protein
MPAREPIRTNLLRQLKKSEVTYVLALEVADDFPVFEHVPEDLEASRHDVVADINAAVWLLPRNRSR